MSSKVLTDKVLRLHFYLDLSVLSDDVLETDVNEPVEGGDLLRHESVLFEVGLDDRPGIVLINFLPACGKLSWVLAL